jgi:CheY-like chemotaxis protein
VLALYRREAGGDLTADSRLVRVTMNLLSIVVERRRIEHSLQESNQRKDEFLAALAHELRNPLAPIRHAVSMLQRPDFDAARLPHTAALLERQVKQLVRLVDDLLDINRVSRGRILLRLSQVNLAEVASQAAETVVAMHPDRAADLEVVVPEAPIRLRADHARLLQVLGNLLSNAFKFSDTGSGVRLAVAQEGSHAVIRVRDQGIGIAPHELRRIFELFVQVDGSKERSPAGLGIGLALAQRLVHLHGGQLSAHSAGPGRGSEFIVHLPLTASAAALEPAPAPAVRADAMTMRVLVVDDNVDAAESLAALLRLVGHRIELAHDGVDALERAEQWQPDAVLLDLGLPRLSGLEVSRRIREQPWGRGMRLVALTGWGQDLDRKRTREAGIDAHLVKPVELEDLLAALRADAVVA